MMSNDDWQGLAEQAVKETRDLSDFGYSGDLPLGETWAFTFSRNRDSDALEESNYATILADLEKQFPDDVEVVHSTHWGHGWVDQIAVRMLGKNGKVTKAGVAALEWKAGLEDYPVADESDYSRREMEASVADIAAEGRISEELATLVWDALSYPAGDDLPSEKKIHETIASILLAVEGDRTTFGRLVPKLTPALHEEIDEMVYDDDGQGPVAEAWMQVNKPDTITDITAALGTVTRREAEVVFDWLSENQPEALLDHMTSHRGLTISEIEDAARAAGI